jgi:hypothetical protein
VPDRNKALLIVLSPSLIDNCIFERFNKTFARHNTLNAQGNSAIRLADAAIFLHSAIQRAEQP